jgi:hypothetical protein
MRTVACRCARGASNKRTGRDAARCPRRARTRRVIIRAMSTRLFQALFCLTRCAFRGEAACRAAKSSPHSPRSLVATMVGCQAYGANQGHMGEAGPPLASPAMPSNVAAQKEVPFASWRQCFPSHLLGTKTQRFRPGWCRVLLASRHSSSTAVVPLLHRMGLVSMIWGPESETIFGLGI